VLGIKENGIRSLWGIVKKTIRQLTREYVNGTAHIRLPPQRLTVLYLMLFYWYLSNKIHHVNKVRQAGKVCMYITSADVLADLKHSSREGVTGIMGGKGSNILLLVVGVGTLLLLVRQLLRHLHARLNERRVVLELVVARVRELVLGAISVARLTLLTNSLALLTLLHTLLLVVHHTLTGGTSGARSVVEEAVLRGVGVGGVLLRITLARQRVLHVILILSAGARVRLRISTTVVHVPIRTLLVGTRTAVRGIELGVGLSLVSDVTLLVNELLHVIRISTSVERVSPSSSVSSAVLVRCNTRLTSGGLLSGRSVLLLTTSVGLSGSAGELRRIVEHLRVHQ
jgi:hypothetical protein